MQNKNKIIIFIVTFFILIAVIISILLYNKSKMTARTLPKEKDTYYVSVEKVKKASLERKTELTGTILANNDVNIIAETSGRVTAIYFKVGDFISKGKVLVQVDDELRLAAFENAKAIYEKSQKDYERITNLHKVNSASDAQLEGAKLLFISAETNYKVTRRQYTDTKITSPISGYITHKAVDLGYLILGPPQSTFIANIVDISSLKVKVNLSETEVFKIKKGEPVEVETEIYPGITFIGNVSSISVKGDDAHTYPVEITLKNNNKYPLKSGMFGKVIFNTLSNNDLLSIPRRAIIGSIKNSKVFIVQDGIAILREVVTGSESGTSVEIIKGLDEGDLVIIDGQSLLKDGVKVTIVD